MITLVEVRPAWDTRTDLRQYRICVLNENGEEVVHDVTKRLFSNIFEAIKTATQFRGASISCLKVLS